MLLPLKVAYLYIRLYTWWNVCSWIQQVANIFYQKLKCLLSVASNVYLIKLILQLHMVIKKTISSLVL